MNRKYEELVGKKFGKFTLTGITKTKGPTNRSTTTLHFVCECGTKKDFLAKKASPIFGGSTISCGCLKKACWGRDYHVWKKDWEKKGLL